MKILVLSFYYPPDLSAGSFRATAMVDALLAHDPEIEIEVVTTAPNRYNSFSDAAPQHESYPRLMIRRIPLPPHRNGFLDQAKAFFTFALSARKMTCGRQYDLVFATSSRLMTATLGALLANHRRVPLYLDIRDIFVDTINDVLPRFGWIAKLAFGLVERWTVRQASRINLVSRGFAGYFEPRYSGKAFSYFTNGVDDAFSQPLDAPKPRADGLCHIVYAGNIGEGQGLHAIVPQLAKALVGRARFTVVGDGGRRTQLETALAEQGVNNVEILPPVGRDVLVRHYVQADVLFLHLNDYPAFHKVLPSKLFEYAATGRPILAGMAGFAAGFAESEIANCAVFPPGDTEAALRSFGRLRFGSTDRTDFVERYLRKRIMTAMAKDVSQTVGHKSPVDPKTYDIGMGWERH